MRISVSVKPLAKQEKIEKIDETNFKIWVKEPPRQGRANEAVRKALAKYFKVALLRVFLISGFSKKNKIFEIN